MFLRNFCRHALLVLAILAVSGVAMAQDYPNKPVRLVVPFAPGGTTDLIARVISEKMGAFLGQTVVVDNKAGAGGAIGAAEVAKAASDGYTLLMSSVSTMAANPAINPAATPYDPVNDFSHIINVCATPIVITANPSFPGKDYKTFLDLLKKNPGKYSYGSAGTGSIGHLLFENFKSSAKVDVIHVAYRGSGPALNDAIAGHVQFVSDNLPSSLPFIKDKRLIPMVVAAPKRLASLPGVPTFSEVGLVSVDRMSFLGVSAPKNTPKKIVDKLNAAVKAALADANVQARLEATGSILVGNSAEEYQKQVADELALYKRVVLEQKLKPE